MKLLIVDDSPAMQTIVRRSLEKAGYSDIQFKMANDGAEALDLIRSWEPDLVITDWHMPNMSGLELLQELRRQMLPTKVGLVTTETSPIRIVEAKEAGALFVVHKPFEIAELQKAVLPVVQGSVEGESLLTNYKSSDDHTGYELQLPSIASLDKILDGFTERHVELSKVGQTDIDYSLLPYVMGLFADNHQDVIKAVSILDFPAATILGCAYNNAHHSDVKTVLESKTLSKEILDNLKRLMKMVSALFYDPNSQQDLKLKGVHLIPKPFDRLDKLGSSSSDKRLDIKISVKQYGTGHMILMAVMD